MNVFFSRDEEMSVHYYYFFSEIESWHYLQDNLEHGVRLKPVKTREKKPHINAKKVQRRVEKTNNCSTDFFSFF